MADKQKDTDQEKAAPKARTKPNLLENKAIVLGVIVIAQALVAIGLTQFVIVPKLGVGTAEVAVHAGDPGQEDGHAAEAKHEKKPKKDKKAEGGGHGGGAAGGGTLADLQEIVVTLAGDSARPRYLRLGISLEMSDAAYVAEVEARRPQLRDAVIMALSDKTAAMLGTPDGKKRLREEIHRRAAEKLPEGALVNVYFSDLVVQ
ncbi:flagellar basal body-associated FliL family protein [bacterium]|nr:flagellar basal body-associated FliL family protein [bacterium]